MKKILYIDCFSGISGDMMLGSLLDCGLDFNDLKKELSKLNINGYELDFKQEIVNGINCVSFKINVIEDQPERSYPQIQEIINKSSLSNKSKSISLSIFDILAKAEAKIHNETFEELHFHEIGAIDSIIDIVGTAIAIDLLKIDEVYCSPAIPLGGGFINTSHGKIPVPAPATLEILKGLPVYSGNFDFEVTTPTGAAILKSLVSCFCDLPLMNILRIGYGKGSRVSKVSEIPNLLRVLIGELNDFTVNKEFFIKVQDAGFGVQSVIHLVTNLDDISSEIISYLFDKLLGEGALDVWTEPILMKKNRQALTLNVLCHEKDEINLSEMIFLETSTLGIRRQKLQRFFLKRKDEIVKLPYGEVKVKIGYLNNKIVTCSPEYESCKKLAIKAKKPLKQVYQDAIFFFSTK